MVPVLVIRPEPGCSQTVAAATAQQMDARGFALFTISARSWPFSWESQWRNGMYSDVISTKRVPDSMRRRARRQPRPKRPVS